MPEAYRRLSVRAEAIQLIDWQASDQIIAWLRDQPGGSRLEAAGGNSAGGVTGNWVRFKVGDSSGAEMTALQDWWVVRTEHGLFTAVPPGVFALNYEKVD